MTAWLTCALLSAACGVHARPATVAAPREFSRVVTLHGKPLELHLATPEIHASPDRLVLYASGDGGWFGAAKGMFRTISHAGYPAVGFSARALLKIERPSAARLDPRQLAHEYSQIIETARAALHLDAATPTIVTGWSRGAAFAVLAATDPTFGQHVDGVIAIGLSRGENLAVGGVDDESDDGRADGEPTAMPFAPYADIHRLHGLPVVVIQSSRDGYLPATEARQLFGADTAEHRFYTIDARNHRFSGGNVAFEHALRSAIDWLAARHAD